MNFFRRERGTLGCIVPCDYFTLLFLCRLLLDRVRGTYAPVSLFFFFPFISFFFFWYFSDCQELRALCEWHKTKEKEFGIQIFNAVNWADGSAEIRNCLLVDIDKFRGVCSPNYSFVCELYIPFDIQFEFTHTHTRGVDGGLLYTHIEKRWWRIIRVEKMNVSDVGAFNSRVELRQL